MKGIFEVNMKEATNIVQNMKEKEVAKIKTNLHIAANVKALFLERCGSGILKVANQIPARK